MKPRSGSRTLRRRLARKRASKSRRGLSALRRFDHRLRASMQTPVRKPRGFGPSLWRLQIRQYRASLDRSNALLARLREAEKKHPARSPGRTMEIALSVRPGRENLVRKLLQG